MSIVLIADGTPAVWQAERAGFNIPSNFSLFATAVQLHRPDIRCTPLNIADGEALPLGAALADFDGVMLPARRFISMIGRPSLPGRLISPGPSLPPAFRSGAAAGGCSSRPWRSEGQLGVTRGDASSRLPGRFP